MANKHKKNRNGSRKQGLPALPAKADISSDVQAEPKEFGIAEELQTFVHNIDAVAMTLPLTMLTVETVEQGTDMDYKSFLDKHCHLKAETEETKEYTVPIQFQTEATRLESKYVRSKVAVGLLPKIFVLALVSQFDFYLSRLLRCLLLARPELLNASEKQMSYGQILTFGSLEAAKEFILEKEIESVMRTSHIDQFDWMETKFSLPLRKGLTVWPAFVELTERRNLFAHCNGIVSSQYRVVCKREGMKESDLPPVGTQLHADKAYFEKGHASLYEIGVKLAHVLWRKLMPGSLKLADDSLNMLIYDLIRQGKYVTAITLGQFAVETIKTYSSEEARRTFVVTLAQAHKWNGQDREAAALMKKYDWSACGHKFKIAQAILNNDFAKAAEVMKQVGVSEEVPEIAYCDWPLFKDFRGSPQFLETFQQVFGKPFEAVVRQGAANKFVVGFARPIEPALSCVQDGSHI